MKWWEYETCFIYAAIERKTYSLWSAALRTKFWFSSFWTKLTFFVVVMTSLSVQFCNILAVFAPMGSFARLQFKKLSSRRIRPLWLTIQLGVGRFSQLWFVLQIGFGRWLRFCWEEKFLVGLEGFLPLPSMSMSRARHSRIAVIHLEQVLLSSHRYTRWFIVSKITNWANHRKF